MPIFRIRIAGRLDLPAVNAIIEQSLRSWTTTERVKRLALPIYRYQQEDLDHMWLLVAKSQEGNLAGVAALEEADKQDLPQQDNGILLHGIYVKPQFMGRGVGGELLEASAGIARSLGYRGLLVKAVRQSTGFFERYGLQAIRATSSSDYPHRYWLATASTIRNHPDHQPCSRAASI